MVMLVSLKVTTSLDLKAHMTAKNKDSTTAFNDINIFILVTFTFVGPVWIGIIFDFWCYIMIIRTLNIQLGRLPQAKKMLLKLIVYPSIMILTWMPNTVYLYTCLDIQDSTCSPSFPFSLFIIYTNLSQGFFNALYYFSSKKHELKICCTRLFPGNKRITSSEEEVIASYNKL